MRHTKVLQDFLRNGILRLEELLQAEFNSRAKRESERGGWTSHEQDWNREFYRFPSSTTITSFASESLNGIKFAHSVQRGLKSASLFPFLSPRA